jgi:phosphatidylglycerophosphate synthase
VCVIDVLVRPVLWLVTPWRFVTPMRVTLSSTVLGLGSAALFLGGHLRSGAILFELHFLFDCIDGKLARLRNIASTRGELADVVSAVLIGYGAFLIRHTHINALLVLAVVGLANAEAFLRQLRTTVTAKSRSTGQGEPATQRYPSWPILYRLVAIMRQRRLVAVPWTVEAETLLLLVLPMIGLHFLTPIFVLSIVMYILICALHIFSSVSAGTA